MTGLFVDIAVMAIPGATQQGTITKDDLEGFTSVTLMRELDEGGLNFTTGFQKHLDALGYTGERNVISFSDLTGKDLNEFFQTCNGNPNSTIGELYLLPTRPLADVAREDQVTLDAIRAKRREEASRNGRGGQRSGRPLATADRPTQRTAPILQRTVQRLRFPSGQTRTR